MRWRHLLVLLGRVLRRLLALLLWCRRWINELWRLHPHDVSHATAAAATPGDSSYTGLWRGSFVLPRRCRWGHLMRHEPWTIPRSGRIGCGNDG